MAGKLKKDLVSLFDMPADLALDLPRITIIGNLQVNIENHKGIVEYTEEKIRILAGKGCLEIYGSGLALKNIQSDQIEVYGEVKGISLDMDK